MAPHERYQTGRSRSHQCGGRRSRRWGARNRVSGMSTPRAEFASRVGERNQGQSVRPFIVFVPQHLMSAHHRWLFSLFIAIDANFRLKLKSRGIKDPELGSGLAYFVNAGKFEAHLKNHTNEGDVSVSICFYQRTEGSRAKRSRHVEPSSMR